MARIPMGNFGQGAGVAPLQPTRVSGGTGVAAQALDRLGQTGLQIASSFINQQQAENNALARAKAGNALLDRELQVKTLADDIGSRMADGSLDYNRAQEAYESALQLLDTPEIDGLDAAGAENYQAGVKRVDFASAATIQAAAAKARRADFRGQTDQALDSYGKLAGLPGADVAKINDQADGLDALGQVAYGAGWAKIKQDFRDRNWFNHGTQQALAVRDNLDGLTQMEADLTSGFYIDKLDPDKRNALLRTVQGDRLRLENKLRHDVDRRESAAESMFNRYEADSGLGIPFSPDRLLAVETAVKGTTFEPRFRALEAQNAEIEKLMQLPPEQLQLTINQLDARLRTEGSAAPARDKALLERLRATASNFQALLANEPLQAVQRRTGQLFEPLNGNDLTDPAKMGKLLAERENHVAALKKQYGASVKSRVLFAAEAEQLKTALAGATDQQQLALFEGLKRGLSPIAYRDTMAQIGQTPLITLAGLYHGKGYTTTEGNSTAAMILKGSKLMADKTLSLPQDGGATGMLTEFDRLIGNAVPAGSQARQTIYQASRAIYAEMAQRENKLGKDTDLSLMRQAVNIATGGVTEYNGAKVVKPYGRSDSQFRTAITAAIQDAAAQSGMPVAALEDLPLERTPDGYMLRNGRNYIGGKDGRPLILKVN